MRSYFVIGRQGGLRSQARILNFLGALPQVTIVSLFIVDSKEVCSRSHPELYTFGGGGSGQSEPDAHWSASADGPGYDQAQGKACYTSRGSTTDDRQCKRGSYPQL